MNNKIWLIIVQTAAILWLPFSCSALDELKPIEKQEKKKTVDIYLSITNIKDFVLTENDEFLIEIRYFDENNGLVWITQKKGTEAHIINSQGQYMISAKGTNYTSKNIFNGTLSKDTTIGLQILPKIK